MANNQDPTLSLLSAALLVIFTTAAAAVWAFFLIVPNLTGEAAYSPSFTDAVWFTLQTITTTGFGSLPSRVWDETPALKWLSNALMVTAVPAWTIALSAFFDLLRRPREPR